MILEIIGPAAGLVGWREIESKYKQAYPLRKVLYSRFEKGVGQIAISTYKQDPKELEKEVTVKADTEEFKVHKPDAAALKKFWDDHGIHFKLCTSKKLQLSSTFPIFYNGKIRKEEEEG